MNLRKLNKFMFKIHMKLKTKFSPHLLHLYIAILKKQCILKPKKDTGW